MQKTYFSYILSVLLIGGEAYAKDAERIQDVIFSSTGFNIEADTEARNVVVVTKEEIVSKGYQNIEQAFSNMMGITFTDKGGGASIDLRGQGDRANSAVKVMVDGVSLNALDLAHGATPLKAIDLESVERIEIIPGGGSVLYGNGTRGGVINVITKKGFRDSVNFALKGGMYERKKGYGGEVALGVSKNIGDILNIQGSINASERNKYRDDSHENGLYTSLKTRIQFSEQQSLQVSYDHYSLDYLEANTLTLQEALDNPKQKGSKPMSEGFMSYNLTAANYENQVNDLLTLNALAFWKNARSTGFREENIGGTLKGRIAYAEGSYFIAGYDYSHQDAKRTITTHFMKDTHSVFALEKHRFNSLFSLLMGTRYEFANYSGKQTSSGVLNYDFDDKTTSNYAIEVTPTFSYSDTGNVYLKYERGYLSPGPSNFINKSEQSVYYVNNLKDEVYDTYEIGMNDYLLGSEIALSLYWTDTNNEIYWEQAGSIFDHNGFFWSYTNLDKTRRLGAELSLAQSLINQALTLKETLTYIDASVLSGVNKGKKVPMVPQYKATIGVSYAINSFLPYADFSFYGKSTDSGHNPVDPYFLADVGVTYTTKNHFKVSAGVRNLFDERYYSYQNASLDAYTPADGRHYFIEGRYAF
ncbi:hypothetical protein CCZ01_07295 [Helicobacter monodelphidis]|uniref:TonB-dependent receptor n=1 Tax=Helicobacter sp. 15-1451 TaxID=2004995 RepID=UPI000DCBC578|nr:TonB-dependent receptor [Helicobacter sp. 15-1451]RAX57141.1 hypothetical protein CCZ01_07295 [Helicobacter sp. 15-1451]